MCLRLSNVSQVCYSLGNVSKNHSCRQGRSAEALRSHGCSGVKSCSSKNSDINGGCLGEIVLLILRIDFARVSSVSSPLVVMPQFVLQPRSFAESIAPQAGILSSLRFDFNPDIMAPKAQMQICQPQRTSMDRNMSGFNLTTYATYAAILIATVYDYWLQQETCHFSKVKGGLPSRAICSWDTIPWHEAAALTMGMPRILNWLHAEPAKYRQLLDQMVNVTFFFEMPRARWWEYRWWLLRPAPSACSHLGYGSRIWEMVKICKPFFWGRMHKWTFDAPYLRPREAEKAGRVCSRCGSASVWLTLRIKK